MVNIEKKYHVVTTVANFAKNTYSYVDSASLFSLAGALALATTALFTVFLINKYSDQNIDKGFKNATWIRPESEKLKQFLYVSRIIINCALLITSPTSFAYALSSATEIYSLVKVSHRKWIHFTVLKLKNIQDQFPKNIVDELLFSLTFRLQQKKENPVSTERGVNPSLETSSDQPECSICLENTPLPNTYFCGRHIFHASCLNEMLLQKTEEVCHNIVVKKRWISKNNYGTSAYYNCTISKGSLPKCPNCRDVPSQQQFSAAFHDTEYGWSNSSLKAVD